MTSTVTMKADDDDIVTKNTEQRRKKERRDVTSYKHKEGEKIFKI